MDTEADLTTVLASCPQCHEELEPIPSRGAAELRVQRLELGPAEAAGNDEASPDARSWERRGPQEQPWGSL